MTPERNCLIERGVSRLRVSALVFFEIVVRSDFGVRLLISRPSARSIGENVQRVITKDTPIVRFTPFPNSRFQAGPETKYTV